MTSTALYCVNLQRPAAKWMLNGSWCPWHLDPGHELRKGCSWGTSFLPCTCIIHAADQSHKKTTNRVGKADDATSRARRTHGPSGMGPSTIHAPSIRPRSNSRQQHHQIRSEHNGRPAPRPCTVAKRLGTEAGAGAGHEPYRGLHGMACLHTHDTQEGLQSPDTHADKKGYY